MSAVRQVFRGAAPGRSGVKAGLTGGPRSARSNLSTRTSRHGGPPPESFRMGAGARRQGALRHARFRSAAPNPFPHLGSRRPSRSTIAPDCDLRSRASAIAHRRRRRGRPSAPCSTAAATMTSGNLCVLRIGLKFRRAQPTTVGTTKIGGCCAGIAVAVCGAATHALIPGRAPAGHRGFGRGAGGPQAQRGARRPRRPRDAAARYLSVSGGRNVPSDLEACSAPRSRRTPACATRCLRRLGQRIGWSRDQPFEPLLIGPLDALAAGRMAVLADPAGAAICGGRLTLARVRILSNEPRTWAMSSLHVTDSEAAAAFYRSVFGWQAESVGACRKPRLRSFGRRATRRRCAAGNPADVAAVMASAPASSTAEVPPHWNVNFQVAEPTPSPSTPPPSAARFSSRRSTRRASGTLPSPIRRARCSPSASSPPVDNPDNPGPRHQHRRDSRTLGAHPRLSIWPARRSRAGATGVLHTYCEDWVASRAHDTGTVSIVAPEAIRFLRRGSRRTERRAAAKVTSRAAGRRSRHRPSATGLTGGSRWWEHVAGDEAASRRYRAPDWCVWRFGPVHRSGARAGRNARGALRPARGRACRRRAGSSRDGSAG